MGTQTKPLMVNQEKGNGKSCHGRHIGRSAKIQAKKNIDQILPAKLCVLYKEGYRWVNSSLNSSAKGQNQPTPALSRAHGRALVPVRRPAWQGRRLAVMVMEKLILFTVGDYCLWGMHGISGRGRKKSKSFFTLPSFNPRSSMAFFALSVDGGNCIKSKLTFRFSSMQT